MNLLQRFCVTLTAKKAAGRFYNSIDREAKLLKTMSSPKLDTENTNNIKETVCGALSAPPVTDSRNSADADNDTQTVAKDDVMTDISGVDAEQPTDKEKPSMLSKRAARRQRRKHARNSGKSPGKTATKNLGLTNEDAIELNETNYYFEKGLRKVYPYYFTFSTHVKGRWVTRTVKDVFTTEFLHGDVARLDEVIESGRVKVNGKQVKVDYKFKDNDFLESTVHRHEVPVVDMPMDILENTDEMVVINKPCSIPVHPCGRYRHNSVTFILAKENGLHNLRTIYRLDRLTSGLLFFAKTEPKTKELMDNIRNREMSKEYVCRVDGEFPDDKRMKCPVCCREIIECCEPLDILTHKLGLWKVGPNGKESHTTFERLSFNGTSSVIRCQLHTGRTHQIRVHLQYLGYPIVNDPLYNCPVWGPERGKGGVFGKPEEQLIKELLEFHVPVKYIKKHESSKESSTVAVVPDLLTDSDLPQPCKKQKLSDSTEQCKKQKLSESTELCADVNSVSVGQSQTCNKRALGENMNLGSSDPTEHACCEAAGHIAMTTTDGQARSSYDSTKMTFDSDCVECQDQYRDPTVEELMMYLHALRYKGPGWEYSTPLPDWAKEDWKE